MSRRGFKRRSREQVSELLPARTNNYTQFGYRVVKTARENQWSIPPDVSEDRHLSGNINFLRRISQALWRDFSQYRGMVRTLVNNVVGQGFGLQARTGDKALNKYLEDIWKSWEERPEVSGRFTWPALQARVFFLMVVDGDCLVLKTESGELQIIEAAQFATNVSGNDTSTEVTNGVERTIFGGKPVAYYLHAYRNGLATGEVIRVDADMAMHIAEFDRPSASRGVPIAVSALSDSHRLKDVFDSSASAWVLQSRMALGLTTEDATAFANSIGDTDGINPDELASRFVNIGEGTVAVLAPGEEIKPIDQNRPGQNFESSVNAFMRPIAMAFDMPLELAILDFSQMNYSSARAAMEQARRGFEVRQLNLERQLHRPVYRWVIGRELANLGRYDLLANPRIFDHEWVKPPWPWIDPQKEIEALGGELGMGLKTHSEVLKARGVERSQWIETRRDEIVNALAVEDEIIRLTGREDIRGMWRMFAGIEIDNNATAAMIQMTPATIEQASNEAEVENDG